MTSEEIRKWIEQIKSEKDDDETQHSLEDKLAWSFIEFVSEANDQKLSPLANEVLKVREIEFARWYA